MPTGVVSLEGATLRGSQTAPVILIEYSDYRCPFCAKAETEILPEITRQYIETGKVQFAFRHHPLVPGAIKAAEAAVCAGRQGRFWQMHSALFKDPKNLVEASLVARARELALDEDRFATCLAGEAAARVQADVDEAEALGLAGTPAFLVGRRRPDGRVQITAMVAGAKPLAEFRKVLDEALRSEKSVN